jgi:hypothetical protein
MRAVDARLMLTLVVAGTCLSGCAGNPAPRAWRQPAVDVQRSTHGGWIRVEADGVNSGGGPPAEGELIAIDETAFYVLSTAGLRTVSRASVPRITIVGYGNRGGTLTLWSLAGGVSTLSHGGFLLLTAPMWAIGGTFSTHSEMHAGIWHDADVAQRFARFPQGLPPGFDPKMLGGLTTSK